jgi:ankyrin repeat protein
MVHRGRVDLAGLLVERGADPESPDSFGFTPLWYAVVFGHVTMVDKLHGANPKLKDKSGDTPADIATRCEKPGLAEFLSSRN